ncbi:MAG: hypothetical protein HY901_23475 [Deltaproteobacteria bacterium]|nr:hypothetical protein [Deltaproteobacteria bacterium]
MRRIRIALSTAFVLCWPAVASAVQEHKGGEAFYLHQTAHILFLASMILLVAVLSRPFAVKDAGWRSIRLAALFFVLWNVDAFVTHMADVLVSPEQGYVTGHSLDMRDAYAFLYYFGSLLENVFLALAFIMLALGLRRLGAQTARVAS